MSQTLFVSVIRRWGQCQRDKKKANIWQKKYIGILCFKATKYIYYGSFFKKKVKLNMSATENIHLNSVSKTVENKPEMIKKR